MRARELLILAQLAKIVVGKPVATERQLEKALRRLEPFEPVHLGVDVAALRRQIAELLPTLDLGGRQPDGI